MIEHVIEWPSSSVVSTVELALQRRRSEQPWWPVIEIGLLHGGRAKPEDDDLPGRFADFRRLLDDGAEHLTAVKRAHRIRCREAAVLARELAAFATQRPAAVLDRPDDEVGSAAAGSRASRPAALTAVSEWVVDEVMVALGLSADAASRLLAESITLVQQLPATLAALEDATISPAHARMLVEVLAPLDDDEVRAGVEQRLLSRAAGRSVAQVRASARRAVLRADASAATRRLATAIRDRSVRVHPGKDGMASLVATMPVPVAQACRKVLEEYADACAVPGDERTRDQRLVDCLADLVLRPDDPTRPAVQASLTIVASVSTMSGGDEPGEVDGQPVPAALVRELAYTLGLLPRPDGAGSTPPEDQDERPGPALSAVPSEGRSADAATAPLARLLNLPTTAGTALTGTPSIAVVDEISGQLLALTSARGIRHAAACGRQGCRSGSRPCSHPPSGPGLGPPPDSPGYRPSDALQRFTRARDRRCRFPGCRVPAARCDLDHNRPWPAGATSCQNLCCLCRHHHRLSHQAPGWTMRRLPDGGLEWTTPSGDRITTHPLPYGSDESPPPAQSPPRPTLQESVLGRPARPEELATDPAPF